VAVGSERLAVHPSLGNGIDGLIAVETEHFGNDCRGSHFDEDDMIETHSVEGVEEGKRALNFMGFDHAFENVVNG
jgi:hypothetical protein